MISMMRRKLKNKFTLSKVSYVVIIAMLSLFSSCSIPVTEVAISGVGRPNLKPVYVKKLMNADLAGQTLTTPTSTTVVMPDHSVGANAQRTVSVSTSMRMLSGMGIQ